MKQDLLKHRALSLCFLVPGLLGLIVSSAISTHYLNSLPRYPDPDSRRMIPRNINGYTVYQTHTEDRALDLIEYPSIAIFLIGVASGLIHLQKFGLARAAESDDEEFTAEEG